MRNAILRRRLSEKFESAKPKNRQRDPLRGGETSGVSEFLVRRKRKCCIITCKAKLQRDIDGVVLSHDGSNTVGRKSSAGEKERHETKLLGSSSRFGHSWNGLSERAVFYTVAAAVEARHHQGHYGFHGESQRRVRVRFGLSDLGRARYPRKSAAHGCGLGGNPPTRRRPA